MAAPAADPRPPRLPEVIANRIEAALIADGIGVGEQLPTELKLAEQYGVSRTVIREAARILEQRGLVDIRSGRGMTVVELDAAPVARHYALMLRTAPAAFGQLMDARLLVEVPLTGLAAAHRSEEDLAELRASIDRVRSNRSNTQLCLDEDLHFHSLVSRASGNPMMSLFVDPVNACLRESYEPDFAYMSRLDSTIDEHQAILDAIAAGDGETASALARTHLERVKRDGISATAQPPSA
jgi:GntR family transcriptional regulator, transcriptional repressor for pyruvate dehydrogenase complex